LFPPEAEYEMQIQEKGIYLGGSIRAARQVIQGKFSSLASLRVTGLTPARKSGSWYRTRTSELSHQKA